MGGGVPYGQVPGVTHDVSFVFGRVLTVQGRPQAYQKYPHISAERNRGLEGGQH